MGAVLKEGGAWPACRATWPSTHAPADSFPSFRPHRRFPIIGAAVGAWTGVWYGAAAVLWPAPPALAAALSTLADVWITGCFHYDGLADTIDGFGGGW